jgi:hypothetical protein
MMLELNDTEVALLMSALSTLISESFSTTEIRLAEEMLKKIEVASAS